MTNAQGAVPVWFGIGRSKDAQYLSLWRNATLTYTPDQEIDHNWNVDRYDIILGQDGSGALFERAAQLTQNNQFYPSRVMKAVSDFSLEDRPVRVGDRVLQRIRLFQYNTLPILEVLTMNEITEVINEPRRAGFTYTTTTRHSEIGEWSPHVEWRPDGEVVLIIEVVSRARPGTSALARRFTRQMQLRAHRLSIENFCALLSGRKEPAAQSQPAALGHLAPVGLLAVALLLFLSVVRSYTQKSA